ncbi:MAG TPA: hypothetical protein DEQ02_05185, partial [Ruminococcaceae bacterium]|nr:hypothetical protein [Oscillospiraceae bacterium]
MSFKKIARKTIIFALLLAFTLSFMNVNAALDTSIPAPSGASLDTNRISMRVQHTWLTAANYTRWLTDYEAADALSLWYTSDGSDPYKDNPAAQRIRINPAVSGQGALNAPRAYILDYTGGTTYKFICYNGDDWSNIYTYTTAVNTPRLELKNNIDPARTNNVLRLTSGLFKRSDVADGIKLFTDSQGASIYYQTAPVVWEPEKSNFAASDVDSVSVADLQANGTVFSAPISAAGLTETNGLAIRAVTVKDGVASAATTYKIRVTDDEDFISLKADADGNLQVDLDAFIAQLTVEEKLMLLG